MDKFAQTIQAGNNVTAPASPLGNFPELANYFKSTFQAPYFATAAGGNIAQAGVNDYNKQQSVTSQIQANNDKIKSLQGQLDPKNYQQIQKKDGGFDYAYIDPITGAQKPVNIAQYSQVTGKTPDQLLKTSTNSLDTQYVNDFNNLQDLTQALATKDQKSLQAIATRLYGDTGTYTKGSKQETAANAKNAAAMAQVSKLSSLKPDDLIKAFTAYYPNIYSNLPWNKLPQGTAGLHGPGQLPAATGGLPSYGR